MFNSLIEQMKEFGNVLTAPAYTGDTFSDIPEDYIDFLHTTNGIYWAGIEFFGTKQTEEKTTGYAITDIKTQNELYQALNPQSTCVFVGRSDDDNFVYNSETKEYEIKDEFSGEIFKSFKTFEELFDYIVKEQIELIQNYVAFDDSENLISEEDDD